MNCVDRIFLPFFSSTVAVARRSTRNNTEKSYWCIAFNSLFVQEVRNMENSLRLREVGLPHFPVKRFPWSLYVSRWKGMEPACMWVLHAGVRLACFLGLLTTSLRRDSLFRAQAEIFWSMPSFRQRLLAAGTARFLQSVNWGLGRTGLKGIKFYLRIIKRKWESC